MDLYPKHIVKEDKDFFFPVMDYFSTDEQRPCWSGSEFGRKMIHEKYQEHHGGAWRTEALVTGLPVKDCQGNTTWNPCSRPAGR